jgi:hypothetical protein
MTTLAKYLTQNGLTVAAFARRLGLPKMTVHRHAKGEAIPRPATMEMYRKATNGQVTPADFYPTPEQTKLSKRSISTSPAHPQR